MNKIYCFLASLLLLWPSIHFGGTGISCLGNSSEKEQEELLVWEQRVEDANMFRDALHRNNYQRVSELLQTAPKPIRDVSTVQAKKNKKIQQNIAIQKYFAKDTHLENLLDLIRANLCDAVAALIKRNPWYVGKYPTYWPFKTVQMAETVQKAGLVKVQAEQGYRLLSKVLIHPDYQPELITFYMDHGADPNYVASTSDVYKDRDNRRKQVTIMNDLAELVPDYGNIQGSDKGYTGSQRDITGTQEFFRQLFIAKVCLLVENGACLNSSRVDPDDQGMLKSYRQNSPWQIKHFLFTQVCEESMPKEYEQRAHVWRQFKVTTLLELRKRLMELWNQKLSDKKMKAWRGEESQSIACLGGIKDMPDLLKIIADYAIDQNYRELENAVYYDDYDYCYDQPWEGLPRRLLCAPEGNYKPCRHAIDREYGLNGCTAPCKEVFEAFGLQKPDPEKYRAMKNSRFAPAKIEVVDE
jgi:hypothetical protein